VITLLGIFGAGILLFAAGPPLDLSPLAFLALVPFYFAAFGRKGREPARLRRAFWVGYATGGIYAVAHLHWLLRLSKEEVTIPWIMIPALLVIGLYLGLFPGLACLWTAWIRRHTGLSPVWVLPVVWTLTDWFRTTGEVGFPWGSLGYTLAPWTAAIQTTAWTGYWFLPAWILWVNGMLWTGLFSTPVDLPGSPPAGRGGVSPLRLGVGIGGAALPIVLGVLILNQAPETVRMVEGSAAPLEATFTVDLEGNSVAFRGGEVERGPAPNRAVLSSRLERPVALGTAKGGLRFSLIQANTPREVKWRAAYREEVVSDLLHRSSQANRAFAPDLIVWPETAAPLRVLWEAPLRDMLRTGISEMGTWTLVGSLDAEKIDGEYEYYNSSILYGVDGKPTQKFPKRHMVPFGELTPYKDKIPFLEKINFGQSDFTAGREASLFVFEPPRDGGERDQRGGRRFSCLICFESTFPELARGDVQSGAEYLVNITNDFWYGRSAGPIQHAQFAIHRAVENRTPMIRCANSGVSFVVDPYGRTHGSTGLFETSLPTADVLPGDGGSFYTRWGDWILWVFAVCAGGWTLLALLRRKDNPSRIPGHRLSEKGSA